MCMAYIGHVEHRRLRCLVKALRNLHCHFRPLAAKPKESWVGPGLCWAQLGHWGTAAGQTHGHVEAATAPTWHHVPLWHPLSPLGSARGAPLGTTMLDWAQVGT